MNLELPRMMVRDDKSLNIHYGKIYPISFRVPMCMYVELSDYEKEYVDRTLREIEPFTQITWIDG